MRRLIYNEHGWVLTEGERITEAGEGVFHGEADERVDARGALILPGAIDDHVHFREPGMTHKGDIHSESRAAAAGGVTTVMDMPNTRPATTTREALEQKMSLGARDSMVNYGFWFGATTDNLAEIKRLDPHTVAGVKVFMGSSTGGMLVDDERVLSAIFAESPVLIGVHCEDEQIIRANVQRFAGQDVTARVHPLIRTAEACYRSTARAVELADKYGSELHVLHLTTARELSLFDAHPTKITAEACVHHLWFTDEDYARLGNLIKVNPAIKTIADREALRDAVLDGKISIVATDHAPHTLSEKEKSYWDAPSGAPAIQHSLCTMLSLFPVEVVVEKMCHAPARRFDLADRGFLQKGMYADIVIVRPIPQTADSVFYKCGWTPQQGARLGWTVEKTFVGGRLAYSGGEFDESVRGSFIHTHNS